VIGADGKFAAFGTDWHYDAYYTHGENTTNIHVNNIMLKPRYRAAIQATLLNGQIVCADPVARANGCAPINVFGGQRPSDAALKPTSSPRTARTSTRSRSRTSPASTSAASPSRAGRDPVALAFGAEYRREAYHVQGDPYGDGSAASPYTADYPADPLLNTRATTGTRATITRAPANTA
jgi:iron complex outermembrane receptor protein